MKTQLIFRGPHVQLSIAGPPPPVSVPPPLLQLLPLRPLVADGFPTLPVFASRSKSEVNRRPVNLEEF